MTESSSSKNMYRMEGLARESRKSPGISGQAAISVVSRCEMNLFITMVRMKNCWRSMVLGCGKSALRSGCSKTALLRLNAHDEFTCIVCYQPLMRTLPVYRAACDERLQPRARGATRAISSRACPVRASTSSVALTSVHDWGTYCVR